MWRIFSKKNRKYTIVGVIAIVVGVYVAWRYLLPAKAQAWLKSFLYDPTTFESARDSGLTANPVSGWKGAGSKDAPMSIDDEPIYSS